MLPRCVLVMIMWIIPLTALAGQQARLLPPDAGQGNAFYYGNRAPLLPSPLVKLPVGAVEPRSWLRAVGITGRGKLHELTEISEFLVKENNAWLERWPGPAAGKKSLLSSKGDSPIPATPS